jgi:hypothetical protein
MPGSSIFRFRNSAVISLNVSPPSQRPSGEPTNLERVFEAGRHSLVLRKPGFEDEAAGFSISGGEWTVIEKTLKARK